jgi:hypothetical protein
MDENDLLAHTRKLYLLQKRRTLEGLKKSRRL